MREPRVRCSCLVVQCFLSVLVITQKPNLLELSGALYALTQIIWKTSTNT